MDSRTKILHNLASRNANASAMAPVYTRRDVDNANNIEKFKETLVRIGGAVLETKTMKGVREYVSQNFENCRSVFVNELTSLAVQEDSRQFDNVDVTILNAHFGVAENGAVWVTDVLATDRVLPFICQHLVVVLKKNMIVPTLLEAYERIGDSNYSYGTLIAGPSKTADIEQSLVLGAHGPKTMTVFLVDDEENH